MRRRLDRERVIVMAAAMADEASSYEAVSLVTLAAALNVRSPSLYNHIYGLDDLRQGMALYGLRQLTDAFRVAAAGLVGNEALLAMAHAYRAFAQDHPGLYPLTIRAPEPAETSLVAVSQELLQTLLLVMAWAGLGGDDALHAIRGLRAILHGFISLEATGGYKMPLDLDESFRRLVGTYLECIAGR